MNLKAFLKHMEELVNKVKKQNVDQKGDNQDEQ